MALVKKVSLKKNSGRKSQIIQFPMVKRIYSSPVTLQGWLQKRGSEGLMLWKKRWFVLSDYCLFYYKDLEEEKLLGSFILASYVISPCSADDKVYKKYSFKAEHSNMRTYYFAADNEALMLQWVNALTMASFLQDVPRRQGKINNSFAALYQNKPNNESQAFSSDSCLQFQSGSSIENQPLYANAPPKPKRLNEASSSERLHEGYVKLVAQDPPLHSGFKSPCLRTNSAAFHPSGHYQRPNPSSTQLPNAHYRQSPLEQSEVTAQRRPPQLKYQPPRPHSVDFLEYESNQFENAVSQKGAEPITLPKRPKSSLSIMNTKDEVFDSVHWSEESYAKKMRESSMYVRPPSESSQIGFVRTTPDKRNPSESQRKEPISRPGLQYRSLHAGYNKDVLNFKRSASARLPDPVSDEPEQIPVLEKIEQKKNQQKEESMKRLLEWKQRMLHSPLTQKSTAADHLKTQPFPSSTISSADGKPRSFRKDESFPPSKWDCPYSVPKGKEVNSCPGAAMFIDSPGSLGGLRGSEPSEAAHSRPSINWTLEDFRKDSYPESPSEGNSHNDNDQECPSPSYVTLRPDATLKPNPSNSKTSLSYSPVVERPSSSFNEPGAQVKTVKNDFSGSGDIYGVNSWETKIDESRVIKEFSYHYIKSDKPEGTMNNRNKMDRYIKNNLKKMSNDKIKDEASTFTPAQSPSSLQGSLKMKSKRLQGQANLNISLMDPKTNDSNFELNESGAKIDSNLDFKQSQTDPEGFYEASNDARPFKIQSHPRFSHVAQHSLISSDDDRDEEVSAVLSQEDKPSCSYSTTGHRQSLSKSLSTPTLQEENYMPMSPRKHVSPASPQKDLSKRVLSPTLAHNSPMDADSDVHEECPYVEMTQSNDKSSNGSSDLKLISRDSKTNQSSNKPSYTETTNSLRRNYDIIYTDMSHQEPLYMEVNNVKDKKRPSPAACESCLSKEEKEVRHGGYITPALPDILNTSAQTYNHSSGRSDSSDADDEASKDLDSIDAPRHPRFSLSDTFRPASYYLGSSLCDRALITISSDHPDSSDSDLVSPPPIPTSSPPLDELDTSIDSSINNRELSLCESREDIHGNYYRESKYGFIECKAIPSSRRAQETVSSEDEEDESVKCEKTDVFLKRRPLSADILNSLRDFHSIDLVPSSDAEFFEDCFTNKQSASALGDHEKHYYSGSKPEERESFMDFKETKENNDFEREIDKHSKFYDCREVKSNNFSKSFSETNLSPKLGHCNCAIVSETDDKLSDKTYQNARAEYHSDYANVHSIMFPHQDQQSSAPYYYSDLLKIDARNMNKEIQPSDWHRFQLGGSRTRMRSSDETTLSPLMCSPLDTTKTRNPVGPKPPESIRFDNEKYEKPLESHRRSRSLEGLLDSTVASPKTLLQDNTCFPNSPSVSSYELCRTTPMKNSPLSKLARPLGGNPDMWEEDSLWRDSLRKMSARHTRSLDDLDKKADQSSEADENQKKHGLYANSEVAKNVGEHSDHRAAIEKDREKIRQWDLMSSAPAVTTSREPSAPRSSSEQHDLQVESISSSHTLSKSLNEPTKSSPMGSADKRRNNWNLKFSAGELLGRTHEELVLLLIQLRRRRAVVCKAMERYHREIEAQACLVDYDPMSRAEHIKRLDELKARLLELEKQYEKGKPLVNLVDNMVKLGSLYQAGPMSVPPHKLEFNHKVQEQRILADERRDWERIRPDNEDLQAKVVQLYRLDRLLQEESGTLHSLQEDKGILERALGGVKNKLQGSLGNSADTEWYRRQQRLLEKELSRVQSILALNSKKLEETVTENARLEQELVVLRQKLQLSRRNTETGGGTTAALESELCRVQHLVGNLLRQRQELSLQVRQLTEKSHTLSQQIWPDSSEASGQSSLRKKYCCNGWVETDLDGSYSSNATISSPSTDPVTSPIYVDTENDNCASYCQNNADFIDDSSPLLSRSPDPYKAESEDDLSKRQCVGSNCKEKPQEIKTVRIVKRESERRQRDRDRSCNLGIPVTYLNNRRSILEEENYYNNTDNETEKKYDMPTNLQTEPPPPIPGPRSDSVNAVWNIVRKNKLKGNIVTGNSSTITDASHLRSDSPQLSPVYLSEAARKIVEEVAWQGKGEKRAVPKEKRRHHTVCGPSNISLKHLYSQKGSRDDLDMERVLRPRLTTPDVVRSTLNRTDPNFTKETIDKILGAPGKIVIPERYVPESQPEMTKEEIQRRSKKADAIRRMLCETTSVTANESQVKENRSSLKYQVEEEKKNREHLLQLNQILAQEVMEKSKMVAVKALATLPLQDLNPEDSETDSDLSPMSSLPLYQQRENFYS